jgi:hypothetical protein
LIFLSSCSLDHVFGLKYKHLEVNASNVKHKVDSMKNFNWRICKRDLTVNSNSVLLTFENLKTN